MPKYKFYEYARWYAHHYGSFFEVVLYCTYQRTVLVVLVIVAVDGINYSIICKLYFEHAERNEARERERASVRERVKDAREEKDAKNELYSHQMVHATANDGGYNFSAFATCYRPHASDFYIFSKN